MAGIFDHLSRLEKYFSTFLSKRCSSKWRNARKVIAAVEKACSRKGGNTGKTRYNGGMRADLSYRYIEVTAVTRRTLYGSPYNAWSKIYRYNAGILTTHIAVTSLTCG